MRASDQLRSVWFTVQSNRGRALLTLLGVMIGSGSLVTLAGLLEGAKGALVALNQGVNESDTVRIYRDDPPPKEAGKPTRPLSAADADALRASVQLGAVEVTPEARREAVARRGRQEKRVRLMGVGTEAAEMYRLSLAAGRFVDEVDLLEGRRVVVIGHEVATQLYAGPVPLGSSLEIDGARWTIIGVLAHKPVMGHGDGTWMWDRRALVPRRAFDATFNPTHEIHSVFLRVRGTPPSRSWVEALGRTAKAIVLRRHLGVHNVQLEDHQGAAQEELILTIIQVLLLGTGLMSLFVGGINIMNIMLVTVTERTKEIGLRRAIGASQRAIWTQFLLESGAIALVGGVLGVVGGALTAWALSLALSQLFGHFAFHLVPWSIAVGLGLALGTGLVFGLFPAWRAAQLDPVEALRFG